VSLLLDTGPHTVTVFMEEEVEDSRGNMVRRPVDVGVVVTGCLLTPITSSRGAFPAMDVSQGQRVDATWKLMARSAPLGWWSRIDWHRSGGAPADLLRLTVLGGPLVYGTSRATQHISATLQEER
jgi:hypothetical protein